MSETTQPETQILVKGIKFAKKKALFQNLKTLDQQLGDEVLYESPALVRSWWKWAIAASILFVLACSLKGLLLSNITPNQQVVMDNFKSYPAIGIQRNETNKNYQQALQFYQANEWQQAISLLQSPKTIEENAMSLFFLGNAYLAENNFLAAIQAFEKFKANDHMIAERNWYLALAYLGATQEEKAIELLQGLQSTNYQSQSTNILKKLKN